MNKNSISIMCWFIGLSSCVAHARVTDVLSRVGRQVMGSQAVAVRRLSSSGSQESRISLERRAALIRANLDKIHSELDSFQDDFDSGSLPFKREWCTTEKQERAFARWDYLSVECDELTRGLVEINNALAKHNSPE